MNIPDKMFNALKTFYDDPRLRIKYMEGKSTWRQQRTGIRQGFPLSVRTRKSLKELTNKVLSGWDDVVKKRKENIRPRNEMIQAGTRMVSDILRDKRQKLIVHIMRYDQKDPLYQVTFDERAVREKACSNNMRRKGSEDQGDTGQKRL